MEGSGLRQGVRERPQAHQHEAPSPLLLFGPWKLSALLAPGRRLVAGGAGGGQGAVGCL